MFVVYQDRSWQDQRSWRRTRGVEWISTCPHKPLCSGALNCYISDRDSAWTRARCTWERRQAQERERLFERSMKLFQWTSAAGALSTFSLHGWLRSCAPVWTTYTQFSLNFSGVTCSMHSPSILNTCQSHSGKTIIIINWIFFFCFVGAVQIEAGCCCSSWDQRGLSNKVYSHFQMFLSCDTVKEQVHNYTKHYCNVYRLLQPMQSFRKIVMHS